MDVLYYAKGPGCDPQPLEREIMSLTHPSGLFLGQCDVGMGNAKAMTMALHLPGSRVGRGRP